MSYKNSGDKSTVPLAKPGEIIKPSVKSAEGFVEVKIEKCEDHPDDIAKALGTFGESYDKVAADELRTLIADRGKKRKFGGSR